MIGELVNNTGNLIFNYNVDYNVNNSSVIDIGESKTNISFIENTVYILPSIQTEVVDFNYISPSTLPTNVIISSVNVTATISISSCSIISNNLLIVSGYIKQSINYKVLGSSTEKKIISNIPYNKSFIPIASKAPFSKASISNISYAVKSNKQVNISIKSVFTMNYGG